MSDPTRNPYRDLAPGAQRLFSVDWVDILPPGVTVSSVAVSVPAPLSVIGSPSVTSGRIGSAMIGGASAGNVGAQYQATFTATFSDGQIDPRVLVLTIKVL